MQNRESAFDLTRNTVTDHRIANPPRTRRSTTRTRATNPNPIATTLPTPTPVQAVSTKLPVASIPADESNLNNPYTPSSPTEEDSDLEGMISADEVSNIQSLINCLKIP